MSHDFNYGILDEIAHRPWRMPEGPWIMTQTWHDLLFAHWPLDPSLLASRLPPGLDLDLFEGQAWLGIVPFHMTNVAPRWVPALPWVSAFPELNVRTYVRVAGRPGVYFFSLDAANRLAVWAARTIFRLPYYSASMHVEHRDGSIHYHSSRTGTPELNIGPRRAHGSSRTVTPELKVGPAGVRGSSSPAELQAAYGPVGPVFQAQPGSLEYFLTERYCLYTIDRKWRAYTVDIHHPPWPLQAAAAEVTVNTMGDAVGTPVTGAPPVLHFAKRQDVVAWPLTRM